MIALIICYSTYFGPKFTEWVTSWFANSPQTTFTEFISKTIGKVLISLITFCVVFILDKFVILREPHKTKEQKLAEKKAAEEEALKPTIKVVNHELAKKFLFAVIITASLSVLGIVFGLLCRINTILIAGSVLMGIAVILLVAFVVEEVGDKVPVDKETYPA
jgi:large-conductance mechanosensitive channel